MKITYTIEVRTGLKHGAGLYINGQLMSYIKDWDDAIATKRPSFFMPDLWTYLAQQKADAKRVEPKEFAKIMRRMMKARPKGKA